jgi:hypothetical protein
LTSDRNRWLFPGSGIEAEKLLTRESVLIEFEKEFTGRCPDSQSGRFFYGQSEGNFAIGGFDEEITTAAEILNGGCVVKLEE